MEFYRADHAMASRRHLNIDVAAIMEQVVTLGGQLTDGPLRKIIVYREFTVIQVCKDLFPEPVQVIKGFRIILASEF